MERKPRRCTASALETFFDFGELDGCSLEELPCLLEYLAVLAYAMFARPFDLHFVVNSFPGPVRHSFLNGFRSGRVGIVIVPLAPI